MPTPLKLIIPKKVVRTIQKEARRMFPRECFVFLLGLQCGTECHVLEGFCPQDDEVSSTNDNVFYKHSFEERAEEYALQGSMKILGSAHSHCLYYKECKTFTGRAEPCPSEGDWNLQEGWDGICGVCAIIQKPDGSFKTRTRFYGSATAVKTVQI